MKKRFTEGQIVGFLREADAGVVDNEDDAKAAYDAAWEALNARRQAAQ